MRHTIHMLIGMAVVLLLTWVSLIAVSGYDNDARASAHASKTDIIASPTSAPTTASAGSGGLDPSITAALIGLGGVFL